MKISIFSFGQSTEGPHGTISFERPYKTSCSGEQYGPLGIMLRMVADKIYFLKSFEDVNFQSEVSIKKGIYRQRHINPESLMEIIWAIYE